jgi:hypothetical protein
MMRLLLLKGGDAAEFFAFQKLQGRAATGPDMCHPLCHARLFTCGRGVPATNNGHV